MKKIDSAKRLACVLVSLVMLLTMSGAGTAPDDSEDQAGDTNVTVQDQSNDTDNAAEDIPAQSNDADASDLSAENTDLPDTADDDAVSEEDDTADTAMPQEQDVTADKPQASQTAEEEPSQLATAAQTEDTKAGTKKITSLDPVTKLKAISGYRAVKLTWKAVPNAQYYIVERAKKGNKKYTKLAKVKKTSYTNKKMPMFQSYTYRVTACRTTNGKTIKSKGTTVSKSCVGMLRIYVTLKSSKTFGKTRLKSGTRIATTGWSIMGKYSFSLKGKSYKVARIATKNPKAVYVKPNKEKNNNYTKEEAEFFINSYVKAKKIKSSKRYLIWVSTYHQHLYVFKKVDGKWTATDKNWEVCTGRARLPSPTGNRVIHKKLSFRRGIKYWSCFASLNGIHGKAGRFSAKDFGTPQTKGCIRSSNANAQWIYRHCAKGTRVIIY